jgi:hypothetical protein
LSHLSRDNLVLILYKLLQVYVTQVMPPFTGGAALGTSLLSDYASALASSCPTCSPTFGSLEGYADGMMLASFLQLQSVHPCKFVNASLSGTARERACLLESAYLNGMHTVSEYRLGPYGDSCALFPGVGCDCNQGMACSICVPPVSDD